MTAPRSGPRIAAVLCVRNEGAFVLEWVAHARLVGFTDILVYSNDCDDGTDRMLENLARMGLVTHVPNPGPHPKGPQWAALVQADRHPVVQSADWVLVCDIDEFVNVHVGAGTIPDLLAALPEASAIALTWRMFGNAGVEVFTDAPITETFTQAAPADLAWPWRAQLFKTLFRRNGTYGKLGVHRPRAPDRALVDKAIWMDGSGRRLGPAFRTGRLFTDIGSAPYDLVQLNHYPLGSMQSYLVKCDRGRANREASAFDLAYWVERNFSATPDRSILRHGDARSALVAQWRTDPDLAALHRAAVDWRKARFLHLMQGEEWRTLFGCLLMSGPTKVIDAATAQRIWLHPRRG